MALQTELIGLIYSTALKPECWPELLEGLSEALEKAKEKIRLSRRARLLDGDELGISHLAPEDMAHSDQAEFEELISHFVQAISIADTLNTAYEQRDALISLINRLPSGVLLADENGKVSVKNRRAERLELKLHGICCLSESLVCRKREDTVKLRAIIDELSTPKALLESGRGLQVRTGNPEEPCVQVSVLPLKQSAFAGYGIPDVSVAIFVNANEGKSTIETSGIKEMYLLTDAESNVLEKLATGLSINDIAESLFISVHTARCHVKRLLQKTSTHRQAELVGLVLSDPLNIASEPALLPTENSASFDFSATMSTRESLECERFKLPDGRFLAYKDYGDPNGEPVFFCHSAKGSRFQVPPIDEQLREWGIRLVVPDRPGFGLSDPMEGQSVYAWSDDLIALANELKCNSFCLGGYSTGGIYALAVAHKYPERVRKVGLIGAGINPTSDEDLNGMLPIHKMVFFLARNSPRIFHPFMKLMAKGILHNPQRYMKKMTSTLCDKDKSTLQLPHVKQWYVKSSFECGRQGTDATNQDIFKYANHPGFEFTEIATPTVLWHGALDQNIPLHLARKLSRELGNAELRIANDQGHLMYYGALADSLRSIVKGDNFASQLKFVRHLQPANT